MCIFAFNIIRFIENLFYAELIDEADLRQNF